jgi:hypothetical protein
MGVLNDDGEDDLPLVICKPPCLVYPFFNHLIVSRETPLVTTEAGNGFISSQI